MKRDVGSSNVASKLGIYAQRNCICRNPGLGDGPDTAYRVN
ncbi:hypothetical protein [Rhizobium ecuadorense]|nr:hypothetical protein [Rhizobium ecuadorense]